MTFQIFHIIISFKEKNIGKWFYNAKYDFKSGTISNYKIKKLKEIGVDLKNIT